jgi:uncharacterized protein
VFRVLLTGIHLMQTGRMEANLIHLNDEYNLPYIPELVARKLAGAEKGTLNRSDNLEFYRGEVMRLRDMLAHLRDVTDLPDEPANRAALDDFLVRVRLDMGMAARV